MKARGIGHSNQVRELILDDTGVHLTDVYAAGGEVLVGTARFEKEASNRILNQRRALELELRRAELRAAESQLQVQLETLKREIEAKRAEIELFENSEMRDVETNAATHAEVQRLRGVDA